VQLAFDTGFDAMIERADSIDVAGTPIAIVRKEDLIAMKRRAAADQRDARASDSVTKPTSSCFSATCLTPTRDGSTRGAYS
jgi:hypothetical protein